MPIPRTKSIFSILNLLEDAEPVVIAYRTPTLEGLQNMRRILNEAIGSRSLITKRSELRHLLCLIDHGIQYYIYQEDPDSFLADNAEYVAHLQQQLEAIVGPLSLNTYA